MQALGIILRQVSVKRLLVFFIAIFVMWWIGSISRYYLVDAAPILFPLDNPHAVYTLEKDPSGVYLVRYKTERPTQPTEAAGSYNWSAAVGSSEIALEPLIGQHVRIIGKFRPVFGAPLCWKSCPPEAGHDGKHEIVIDIENVELLNLRP